MSKLEMTGNIGCYIDDDSVISFQMGDNIQSSARSSDLLFNNPASVGPDLIWHSIKGFNVASRGRNNMKCEEITADIKNNRLLPTLIRKKVNMLYGRGLAVYKTVFADGKYKREWVENEAIGKWLDSWKNAGLESDAKEVAKAIIKNYYYFSDFFVKWRFTVGKQFGAIPVAGLEIMENAQCRLATQRKDVATSLTYYNDFKHIAVGRWNYGISNYQIYHKFNVADIAKYRFAAISHHREKSVDEFYGVNETHQGTKTYIKGSNDTAGYINSFIKNSLAAKIHIIIPNAWIQSKRAQITNLCEENKKRKADNKDLLKLNGIELGISFKESTLMKYVKSEMRNISKYLSGMDNQGKAYSTISFKNGQGEEERWKFEVVDLKYKEYIDALISFDKRADEVLLSSVGLDSSISSVSKDGVISKSGSDAYYNYLIYLMSLTPEEEVCAEPFNLALQVNFPALYKEGLRIGFYREIPNRQEDIKPNDRLNQQQS